MSKAKSELSAVGIVHTPKNEKRPVAYVQLMAGEKKAGGFIRADYVAWFLANPAATQAAITSAEGQLPKPAPVVAAPIAVAAVPAAAVPAGFDPSAMVAMMQQWQAMAAHCAALGIAIPDLAAAPVAAAVAPAPAVSSTPAPAPAVKPAPLSDANAARVRAIAKR